MDQSGHVSMIEHATELIYEIAELTKPLLRT